MSVFCVPLRSKQLSQRAVQRTLESSEGCNQFSKEWETEAEPFDSDVPSGNKGKSIPGGRTRVKAGSLEPSPPAKGLGPTPEPGGGSKRPVRLQTQCQGVSILSCRCHIRGLLGAKQCCPINDQSSAEDGKGCRSTDPREETRSRALAVGMERGWPL